MTQWLSGQKGKQPDAATLPRGHVATFLFCWVVSGCASAPLRTTATSQSPAPLPAELATYYDYPNHTPTATRGLLREHRTFREFLIRFPLSTPGFESTEPIVEFEWFESRQAGRRPAILFNPILGGDYPLERGICRFFASHGFHVALVHRKTLKIAPEHDVGHLELLLRQGVLRIRQVVDWMAAEERVDPTRMGSFGISMGGIAGTMAAAIEPRLRAHVIALAGGSIADIVRTSRDRLLTKPRQRYLESHHMDLQTMSQLMQEHITTDPIRLAPYVYRQRVFMVIALADRTIGRANALRLWRALGRPRTVFIPLGHYTTYLTLPYLKYASLRFFRERLVPDLSVVGSP